MMKITLQVNEREMTFSEEELVAILEKHFNAQEAQQKEVQTPTEGKWFEVKPAEIDQSLFSEEKSDEYQERTRQLILEAFAKMENNSKYARAFKTLMPEKEKTLGVETVGELEEIACHLGDHMTDWVEWALELAQRIANGETWRAVCNDPDTANWYRLIEWKNGNVKLIGGSRKDGNYTSASYVFCYTNRVDFSVPLVTAYDK